MLKGNDLNLWNDFLNGNNQALSMIYLQHANALYDYGCKFSNDKSLVKDCIQDVFSILIKNRKNLSPTNNIQLYLFKALKRKLIREMQKKNRFEEIIDSNSVDFKVVFSNLNSGELELDKQKQKLLEQALAELTARQKEAIYLRFTRELDYKEISSILDLNYQSARALIHRAINKLREILQVNKKQFNQFLWCVFGETTEYVL